MRILDRYNIKNISKCPDISICKYLVWNHVTRQMNISTAKPDILSKMTSPRVSQISSSPTKSLAEEG